MEAGFEILGTETGPGYVTTDVRFTATDGRVEEKRLGWSDRDTQEAILKSLQMMYKDFEARGAEAPDKFAGLKGHKHVAQPASQRTAVSGQKVPGSDP